jgi:hypothetical protein
MCSATRGKYADTFEAMMNTSARIQALDHGRADRTLLAVGFQTYQLGGEPTALTISPLAEKLKSDLDRVRLLSQQSPRSCRASIKSIRNFPNSIASTTSSRSSIGRLNRA